MTIMPLKQRTNNMFWTNFKLSLKQNKKMLIVISILQMLGLPMLSVLLTAVAIDEESMSEISIGFFCNDLIILHSCLHILRYNYSCK